MVLKTDFKDNEIAFAASANVGYSTFGKEDFLNTAFAADVLDASGLGDFSNNELDKASAGKRAGVRSVSVLSIMV